MLPNLSSPLPPLFFLFFVLWGMNASDYGEISVSTYFLILKNGLWNSVNEGKIDGEQKWVNSQTIPNLERGKKKRKLLSTAESYECWLPPLMLFKLHSSDRRMRLRWFNQATCAIFPIEKLHWKLNSPHRGAGSWLLMLQPELPLLHLMTNLHCSFQQNTGKVVAEDSMEFTIF